MRAARYDFGSLSPDGDEPPVTLSVVEPKKVPAAVGGRTEESENASEEQPEEPAPAPPAAEDAPPAS